MISTLRRLFGKSQEKENIIEFTRASLKKGEEAEGFCTQCGSHFVKYPADTSYDANTGARIENFDIRCPTDCDHMRESYGWGYNHKKRSVNEGADICIRCGDVFSCWGLPGF